VSEGADADLVAVSEGIWSAFNARDWDRFFSLTTSDYVVRTDPRWPGGGEFHGRDELLRFLEQFLEPWEELRYERMAEPEPINGCVVERGRWAGRGRATGIEGSIEFTSVATLRDGLVARIDFFIDHGEALEFVRGV
jgi:ketosteroid isomerase-like protein